MKINEPALLIPAKRKLWFKVEPAPGAIKPKRRGSGPASKEYELNFRESGKINAALSDRADVTAARVLACNSAEGIVCCQGVTPGHAGFVLSKQEAAPLIASSVQAAEAIFPYLVGREMLQGDGTPARFVIDLGQRELFDAQQSGAVFAHLQQEVLPDLQQRADDAHESDTTRSDQLERWWMHWRPRRDLIRAIASKQRFLICSRVTKRPIFAFIRREIRPGDALQCFAFDDDYSFGILQSNTHWQWFVAKCSKLKSDFRYTPESVFDTFPWPQAPAAGHVAAVAAAGREVRRVRDDALTKVKGGLRAVYRTLELPGKNPLKDAHAALDAAVLAAYGFSPKKDLLTQLLDLNLAVADAIDRGGKVTAPGVPPDYPNPKALITTDCIRPA